MAGLLSITDWTTHCKLLPSVGGTVGFGGFGNSLSAEDGASASSPNALQGRLVESGLASAALRRWIDVSSAEGVRMPYKRFSLLGSTFSIPQISPDF
jgi:hypothetical protein